MCLLVTQRLQWNSTKIKYFNVKIFFLLSCFLVFLREKIITSWRRERSFHDEPPIISRRHLQFGATKSQRQSSIKKKASVVVFIEKYTRYTISPSTAQSNQHRQHHNTTSFNWCNVLEPRIEWWRHHSFWNAPFTSKSNTI